MIRTLLFLILLLTLYSCRNYNSERYIANENEAIRDVIFQLTDFDNMVKWNCLDTNHLKLYLLSSLDTVIYKIYEPEGFVTRENTIKLPAEDFKEGERIYEEEYEKYKREIRLFAPLKKGLLKARTLDYKFEFSNLQVELIPDTPNILYPLKPNELGYLSISRIIFNRRYNKGYLSYSFYCGEGCVWVNNVEITKINGEWVISEYFSGGIANYRAFNKQYWQYDVAGNSVAMS